LLEAPISISTVIGPLASAGTVQNRRAPPVAAASRIGRQRRRRAPIPSSPRASRAAHGTGSSLAASNLDLAPLAGMSKLKALTTTPQLRDDGHLDLERPAIVWGED
jgi:hypothetical protein